MGYVSLIFDEKNEFAVNNIESITVDVFKDKYVLSLIFMESLFAPDNLYKSEIFYKKNKLLKEIVKYFKK